MRKNRTQDEKDQYCQDFLNSSLTQTQFCLKKQLSFSVFHRWLRDYRHKNPLASNSKLVQIKLNHSIPTDHFDAIQMFLPNGIRIDLPPRFNPGSLQAILESVKR